MQLILFLPFLAWLVTSAPLNGTTSVASLPEEPLQGSQAFQQAVALEDESPAIQTLQAGEDSIRTIRNKYRKYVKQVLTSRSSTATCNANNVLVRKEWGSMSVDDRLKYTAAVKCLYNKPSKSDPNQVPGARNRLDDFVAAHIIQSNNIHFNGNLFQFHRHFTFLYDQALRKECDYAGPTPYWDWTLSSKDPRKAPIFDGSATSMGGNGEIEPHGATYINVFNLDLVLPPGTGGGCVTSGPFTDLKIHLGLTPNVSATTDSIPKSLNLQETQNLDEAVSNSNSSQPLQFIVAPEIINGVNPALQYNERCLRRDINLAWSALSSTSALTHLLNCDTVVCLEKRADGWEQGGKSDYDKKNTIHSAGHFSVGGLANDPYASPGDPIFYLHHGMMDRVWSLWQAQDPNARFYQVGGSKTPFNNPPSVEVALDDTLDFGVVGKPVTLRQMAFTIDGDYCYMYD